MHFFKKYSVITCLTKYCIIIIIIIIIIVIINMLCCLLSNLSCDCTPSEMFSYGSGSFTVFTACFTVIPSTRKQEAE